MNKNTRLNVLLVLFALCISFGFANNAVHAQTLKTVRIQVKKNGQPVANKNVGAYDLTKFYKKIKSGKFTEADFDDTSVRQLNATYKRMGNNKYMVAKKLVFGVGKKNSEKDAKRIAAIVAVNNLEFALHTEGIVITDQAKGLVPFSSSNNKQKISQPVTGDNGDAQTKLNKDGFFVIKDFNGHNKSEAFFPNDVKKTLVAENNKWQRDNSSIAIQNIHAKQQTKDGYSVEAGQIINYKLTVKMPKSDALSNNKIRISFVPDANLVIDAVSGAKSKQNFPLISKTITMQTVNSGKKNSVRNISTAVFNEAAATQTISTAVSNEWLHRGLTVQAVDLSALPVDTTGRTLTFNVKAHLASTYTYKGVKLAYSQGGKETSYTGNIKTALTNNKKYSMVVNVALGGQNVKLSTEDVYTRADNFITYDDNDGQLVNGVTYVLGRLNQKKNIEFYSGNKKGQPVWKNSGMRSSSIKGNDFGGTNVASLHKIILKNKKIYQFNSGHKYSLDTKKSVGKLDNAGKLSVLGLMDGQQYFLVQVGHIKNYQQQNKVIAFTTSYKDEQNGQEKLFNTWEKPLAQNYALSEFAPENIEKTAGYVNGMSSYNTIPMTHVGKRDILSKKHIQLRFTVYLIITVGLVLVIGVLVFVKL